MPNDLVHVYKSFGLYLPKEQSDYLPLSPLTPTNKLTIL